MQILQFHPIHVNGDGGLSVAPMRFTAMTWTIRLYASILDRANVI
jgi:hypothetical protein